MIANKRTRCIPIIIQNVVPFRVIFYCIILYYGIHFFLELQMFYSKFSYHIVWVLYFLFTIFCTRLGSTFGTFAHIAFCSQSFYNLPQYARLHVYFTLYYRIDNSMLVFNVCLVWCFSVIAVNYFSYLVNNYFCIIHFSQSNSVYVTNYSFFLWCWKNLHVLYSTKYHKIIFVQFYNVLNHKLYITSYPIWALLFLMYKLVFWHRKCIAFREIVSRTAIISMCYHYVTTLLLQ